MKKIKFLLILSLMIPLIVSCNYNNLNSSNSSGFSSNLDSSVNIEDYPNTSYYLQIDNWDNYEDLKAKLQILNQNHITYLPYNSNWEVNSLADQSLKNFDMVSQVYSYEDTLKTNTYSSSNTAGWQKEHAFCQSLMNHYVSSMEKYLTINDSMKVKSIKIVNSQFQIEHIDSSFTYSSMLGKSYSYQDTKTAVDLYLIENNQLVKKTKISSSYVGETMVLCDVSNIKEITSVGISSFDFSDVNVITKDETIALGEINRLYFNFDGEGSKGGVSSDYHNIFAALGNGNSSRGNKELGTVNNPNIIQEGYKSNQSTFEPSDKDKGKLARAILYMDLMYDDINLLDGNYDINQVLFEGYGIHGNRDTILSWASTYKVDYLEYQHNQVVYSYQNNRNPFVDFPNLVDYLYGDKKNSSGTLTDLIENSSYYQLDMENDETMNIAIEGVKYQYQVGEQYSLFDINSIYEVKKNLSTLKIENRNDVTSSIVDNYTFTTNDIGKKLVTVNYQNFSTSYYIEILAKDNSNECEYQYSFIVDNAANSGIFGSGSEILSSTNPKTIDLGGIEFKFSLEEGKRGTGSKDKGVGFGSSTTPIKTLTIESIEPLTYENMNLVKGIYINSSCAKDGNYTVKIYFDDQEVFVGDYNNFDSQMNEFVFDEVQSGKVKIVFSNVNKTLYLKDIRIDFE